MDLLPTDEQQEIVSVVAGFLRSELPIEGLRERRGEPAPIEPGVWRRCGELGWFGLGLPEALGGVGYGLAEEALLFRELGRYLAPGPFVASVLGARVAALAGNGAVAAEILAGGAPVGLAEARTDAVVVGETVSGAFDLIDVAGSKYVLVCGLDAVAVVRTERLGDVAPLACIDPAVRLARTELGAVGAVAHLVGAPVHDEVLLHGLVLIAAMHCGIAEATRDLSTEYAKVREQFGKPIGVHQAIKHVCADMAVRAHAATSLLFFAALSVDEARTDAAFQANAARIVAADAAIENATHTIQVHGGIGYTFEHDAHLYLKRARVLDRMLGESRRHMATLIDLPAAQ